MPLGGLLPYDDDEEELRRRKPIMLQPPRDPNALPELPEPTPRPRMLPPPSPEIPGGAMPSPPLAGPRGRGAEVAEARDVYMQGTPQGFGGRLKSAGLGALQGLAGGGVGGAIAGAATGAISPRTVRRQQFRQEIQPQIAERFAFEDQERARQRQAEQDALNDEFKRAQIGATNRSNMPRPPDPSFTYTPAGPMNTRTGASPTGGPMALPPPKAPAQRLITFEGKTYDYNDPVQRKALEDAQNKLPRDKFGRAVSRPDERATARAGKGAKGKQPPKVVSMTQIRQYMKDTGKSRTDAIADAMRDGYRIAK